MVPAALKVRPFLSKLAQRRLEGLSPVAITPALESLHGAVLWTDVTGFTALAERLSSRGPSGAERLSELLDTCYASILSVVEQSGGDVQFFAGDGALVLWPVASAAGLAQATAQATAAAHRLAAELPASATAEFPLQMRSAVGSGPLTAATLGGVAGQWVHLVGGESVHQVALAIKTSTPGAVASSPEAQAQAHVQFDAEPPATRPPARDRDAVPAVDPATLERFLLPPVATVLRAQQAGFLAEFRTVSVVFLALSGLGWELDLRTIQPAVVRLQQLLRDHGGLLYQLVQDDTGTTAVAVFGLPGASHDDDPVRAVRFARAARQALAGAAGAPRCGVATGPVFCGDCGNQTRRQYSLFGTPLNRAARLMASASDDLLVDEATFGLAERRLSFSDYGPLRVKGFGEPLHAYRGGEVRQALPADTGLFGRQTERLIIARRVEQYVRNGEPMLLLLEGPPGIGKTALLREVASCCENELAPLAFGAGDPLEGRTPYYPLRAVVRRLLDLDAATDDPEAAAGRRLAELGEDPSLLPLLNPFLAQPVKETTLTRQLAGSVRAENRTRLVAALVVAATRERRLVVVIDDAHWLDTPSWAPARCLAGVGPAPGLGAGHPAADLGAGGLPGDGPGGHLAAPGGAAAGGGRGAGGRPVGRVPGGSRGARLLARPGRGQPAVLPGDGPVAAERRARAAGRRRLPAGAGLRAAHRQRHAGDVLVPDQESAGHGRSGGAAVAQGRQRDGPAVRDLGGPRGAGRRR